ncbi:MAG: valine--tRNA ligase [Chloroflexi bacterium]|nr:valine--tRNA ligase [Chloroflexota bacterium]
MTTTRSAASPAPDSSPQGAMPEALLRPYDPAAVEPGIYAAWEGSGAFRAEVDPDREPYSIAMPPPNLTGALHYGHVAFVTFQDLMIRWQRMRGVPALWLPGTDHAAIATNAVLVNQLAGEGKSREDIGRPAFEEMFWDWMRQSGQRIRSQLRMAGASCDWSRERFTMDPGLSRAVNAAFVQLYEKGLIYRGSYLVNWDPVDQTAISDIEVEYQEVDGWLWTVRYPLAEGGHLEVATTRPETILGDTAIAVNPADERYRDLVGKQALVPVLGRSIPIVADDYVDPEFGSGAVKVTPGHDPNDYAIGQRHDLPMINILELDGRLNDNAGPFAGQTREAARANLLDRLEGDGLLAGRSPHRHAVGHGQRSGAVIEPMLSQQWFVDTSSMAAKAAAAVRSGEIQFHPPRFAQVFLHWMDNIRDWCISRQIWVGHRIPVWYCESCPEPIVATDDPGTCPDCGGNLRQDSDVLDTWFSSGLWTFSTLGWPDETEDLAYFHPTTVMETGYDIIFFWVARMAMLSLELLDQIPFRHVYLNGLLRRADGSKVSKSDPQPGDDPAEVIGEFGADAVRYLIATGSSPGNDMKLSWDRLTAARNFANKLWNAARFVIAAEQPPGTARAAPTAFDSWILERRDQTVATVSQLLERFQFGEAGQAVHDLLWRDFCDWYIEAAKLRLAGPDKAAAAQAAAVLREVFLDGLKLLHPYMPFVTEALWGHLQAGRGASDLIVASWPEPGKPDSVRERTAGNVSALQAAIGAIRRVRSDFRIDPGALVPAEIVPGPAAAEIESEADVIKRLARISELEIAGAQSGDVAESGAIMRRHDRRCAFVAAEGIQVYLPLEELLDLDAERARAADRAKDLQARRGRLQGMLANPGFVGKAPAAVVEQRRTELATISADLDNVLKFISELDA